MCCSERLLTGNLRGNRERPEMAGQRPSSLNASGLIVDGRRTTLSRWSSRTKQSFAGGGNAHSTCYRLLPAKGARAALLGMVSECRIARFAGDDAPGDTNQRSLSNASS